MTEQSYQEGDAAAGGVPGEFRSRALIFAPLRPLARLHHG